MFPICVIVIIFIFCTVIRKKTAKIEHKRVGINVLSSHDPYIPASTSLMPLDLIKCDVITSFTMAVWQWQWKEVQIRVPLTNQTLNLTIPNPNHTFKQHAVVRSIQLNIVACPAYPEKFIRVNETMSLHRVYNDRSVLRSHCHTAVYDGIFRPACDMAQRGAATLLLTAQISVILLMTVRGYFRAYTLCLKMSLL